MGVGAEGGGKGGLPRAGGRGGRKGEGERLIDSLSHGEAPPPEPQLQHFLQQNGEGAAGLRPPWAKPASPSQWPRGSELPGHLPWDSCGCELSQLHRQGASPWWGQEFPEVPGPQMPRRHLLGRGRPAAHCICILCVRSRLGLNLLRGLTRLRDSPKDTLTARAGPAGCCRTHLSAPLDL